MKSPGRDQLSTFVGDYLHEDWDLEYSGPEDAFADFARSLSAEARHSLVGELESMLAKSDGQLRRDLDSLNGAYSLSVALNDTARAWLAARLLEVQRLGD